MAATQRVAKALLLDENGSFLLLRRGQDHPFLAGFFDLPGGMVEPSEEPGAAVIREIREETGLVLTHQDLRILYATTQLLHGKSYPTLLYLARFSGASPDITISWEHQSYEWAPIDRLAEVEPQFAPTYREALDYVRTNGILQDIDS